MGTIFQRYLLFLSTLAPVQASNNAWTVLGITQTIPNSMITPKDLKKTNTLRAILTNDPLIPDSSYTCISPIYHMLAIRP